MLALHGVARVRTAPDTTALAAALDALFGPLAPGIDRHADADRLGRRLRGKIVRLRGKVRAASSDPAGAAALWLRIDRPQRAVGFFDNMDKRPIREPEWRDYAIEGPVSDDAVAVAFGVMASGAIAADFDAIELAVRGPAGDWTPIQNCSEKTRIT